MRTNRPRELEVTAYLEDHPTFGEIDIIVSCLIHGRHVKGNWASEPEEPEIEYIKAVVDGNDGDEHDGKEVDVELLKDYLKDLEPDILSDILRDDMDDYYDAMEARHDYAMGR